MPASEFLPPVQGIFDFDTGHANGFANWEREQQHRVQAIKEEWALPIGRRVRLGLKNIDGEFEGKLELAEFPVSIDRRVPLRLRIAGVEGWSPDIERCVVIAEAPAAEQRSHSRPG